MSQNSSDQCRGWKRVERKRERERESEEWRAEERVLEVFPRGLSELLAIVVMRTGWTAQEKKKKQKQKSITIKVPEKQPDLQALFRDLTEIRKNHETPFPSELQVNGLHHGVTSLPVCCLLYIYTPVY